jgi:hypothetical protein
VHDATSIHMGEEMLGERFTTAQQGLSTAARDIGADVNRIGQVIGAHVNDTPIDAHKTNSTIITPTNSISSGSEDGRFMSVTVTVWAARNPVPAAQILATYAQDETRSHPHVR